MTTGYVYKICIKDGSINDCYVGSTFSYRQRKSYHKNCCSNTNNKEHHNYLYQFIINNGNWENWTMLILEKIDDIDKYQLKLKEREYIELIKPSLNKNIPMNYQTGEIWNIKEYYNVYAKKYRINNKDKYIEYQKEYRKNNNEYQKKYYENNKDRLKEYQKKNYAKKRKNNKNILII